MNYGKALKEIREARGYTIEKLAIELCEKIHKSDKTQRDILEDITAKWIEGVEKEHQVPMQHQIVDILSVLEVDAKVLAILSIDEDDIQLDKVEIYKQLLELIRNLALSLIDKKEK